jgi:hypothetical protein
MLADSPVGTVGATGRVVNVRFVETPVPEELTAQDWKSYTLLPVNPVILELNAPDCTVVPEAEVP